MKVSPPQVSDRKAEKWNYKGIELNVGFKSTITHLGLKIENWIEEQDEEPVFCSKIVEHDIVVKERDPSKLANTSFRKEISRITGRDYKFNKIDTFWGFKKEVQKTDERDKIIQDLQEKEK